MRRAIAALGLLLVVRARAEPAPAPAPAHTPPVSLATRIKRGLSERPAAGPGGIRVTRVQLYPEVVAMSDAELDAALAGDAPFPVGIVETRSHGRLLVTCHATTCTAKAGDAELVLALVDPANTSPTP